MKKTMIMDYGHGPRVGQNLEKLNRFGPAQCIDFLNFLGAKVQKFIMFKKSLEIGGGLKLPPRFDARAA